MNKNILKRIQYLRNEVVKHDKLYDENKPIITDIKILG